MSTHDVINQQRGYSLITLCIGLHPLHHIVGSLVEETESKKCQRLREELESAELEECLQIMKFL